MATESWSRVVALFDEAVEQPPGERRAFLNRACGDDAELRREVESLLAAEDEAGGFLDRSALERCAGKGEARPPEQRRSIGPYKILRRIGEGGMSAVYLAVRADDEYHQKVAIKVFSLGRERRDLLRRFRTERQILASFEHPSIARLLDGGTTEDGLPYIVMEAIEAEPIDVYCDRQRLSIDRRIELFRTLCSAVQYAHQKLVVHRDIKPSNVLVTAEGVPKLLDFGIAKPVNPECFPQTVQHTATGQRLMTPQYASPEQVQGGLITTASDVYSMGVLLHYLLTGHLPYRVATRQTAEIERAVIEEEPERPSAAVSRVETMTPDSVSWRRGTRPDRLRRQLAGDLDNIVLKALRKEPHRRYGSIEQLDQDLQRYQQGLPVVARPDTLRYRAGKFLRRHRFGVAAGAAFVLLVIGFAITMWVQATRIAHQRDQARRERDKAQEVAAFLEEIFQVSDPSEARGETVTAREILERGAERLDRELADQPEIRATLAGTIGNVYRNLGLYDRAEPLLEASFEVRRQVLGEAHPEVADSLSGLGKLLRLRGDFEGAEPLLRQALDLRRKALGATHPAVAESLNDLGAMLRDAGRYEAAKTLLLEALELRRLPGSNPERLVETLSDLGELYGQQDDQPAAEALFREALETARRLFGEVHPEVAEALNSLAVTLAIQGKYAAAEPLLGQVLEQYRKLYGDRHPYMAVVMNNLAKLRSEMGDLAGAQELYWEALKVVREATDGRNPQVVGILNNLANLLAAEGELAAAEPLYREALERGREVLGDDHFHVGHSLLGLGSIMVARGEAAAAEPLLRQSLAIQHRAFAEDHRRVAAAQSALGQCLTALGRFEEAEPLVLAGYDKLATKLGPGHWRTAGALDRVIELYDAWGRLQEAAAYRDRKTSPQ